MATLSQFKIRDDFIFDPSLVLYLPLYQLDGSSFMSKDAYGHLCTVTGAVWKPCGRDFDGTDDYVDCGGASSLAVTEFTFEAWFKSRADAAAALYRLAIQKKTSFAFGIYYDGANSEFYVATYDGSWNDYSSDYTMPLNTWKHLVATRDSGGTIKLYADTDLKKTYAGTATPDTNADTLSVGADIGGGSPAHEIDGILGEVRLYNRALTPLEVQHNYLATKGRYR